ncbi:hypothetical protein PM082_015096 [Marasmius tenuissimus]|nr:hypothetical protein PM082_015096 [Marasmius tenuissimus]
MEERGYRPSDCRALRPRFRTQPHCQGHKRPCERDQNARQVSSAQSPSVSYQQQPTSCSFSLLLTLSIMSGSAEGHYPSPPASNRSSPQISVDSIRQLDQAYQRVRQLRRDILQTYIPRTQDNSMGPPHEAIVLSGGESNERQNSSDSDSALLERLNAPVPQETMDRLRQFEAAQLTDAEHPTRTLRSLRMTTSHLVPEESSTPSSPRLPSLRPHNLNLPPSPISPISPPRQPFLPPRTLEPSHTPRWTTLSDDPHTSLGRRVAAVLGTSNDHPTTTTTTTPPDQGVSDGRRTSQTPLARDLEHVLSISRHQRSELAQMYIESYRHEMDRMSRNNQDTGASSSPSSSPRNGMRRARQIRAESRQNSGSGSGSGSRLSTLSNFSVQNLPTPTTSHQPPLLFEEPTSYEPFPHPEERMESIYEEGRNFVSNLRQEVVEGGPWDSARRVSSSSMFASPSRESEYYRRRVVRYPEDVVPASNVVRLNADGDPIPFTGDSHEHSHWPRWNNNSSNSSDDLRSHHHPHQHLRANHHIVMLPDGREEIWAAEQFEINSRPRAILGKSDPYCPDYLPMPLPSERETGSGDIEVSVSRAGCLIAR